MACVPAPVCDQPLPMASLLVPMRDQSLPMACLPAPVCDQPLPMACLPAPVCDQSLPMACLPAPVCDQSLPMACLPAPVCDPALPVACVLALVSGFLLLHKAVPSPNHLYRQGWTPCSDTGKAWRCDPHLASLAQWTPHSDGVTDADSQHQNSKPLIT